jgi:hypothetical protein
MTIMVILLALGALLEVGLHGIRPLWRVRRTLVLIAAALTAFGSGGLLMWRPNIATGGLLLVSLYRLFNDVRIVKGRMHERYLLRTTRRTSFALLGWQMLIAACWLAWQAWPPYHVGHLIWTGIAGAQGVSALVLVISTVRSIRRTTWPAEVPHLSDSQLPTVSVAIPARNETDDLEACLQNLVASKYPKLEILVLDDCSQNKRTPEIIRGFAHDGVRFIQGEAPSDTWLPKNQAYQRLAQEASGEILLFCGVDVRFAPDSIRQLVSLMQGKHKQMMSIMPARSPEARGRFTFVQAMRYWWEIVPPRRLFHRPPVMSSCWLIARTALTAAGGFAAVTRSILPEAYFAKRTIEHDGYSFMRSSAALGVQSVKQSADQRSTAIRMRYPQLHRRPEWVLLLTCAELFFLVLPFVIAIGGFWLSVGAVVQAMATAASVLLIVSYVLLARATRVNMLWFALVALPFVVLTDVGLLQYSMRQYELATVEWRGRNVCIPVMHVVPHLPKLPD